MENSEILAYLRDNVWGETLKSYILRYIKQNGLTEDQHGLLTDVFEMIKVDQEKQPWMFSRNPDVFAYSKFEGFIQPEETIGEFKLY